MCSEDHCWLLNIDVHLIISKTGRLTGNVHETEGVFSVFSATFILNIMYSDIYLISYACDICRNTC
jgi:hypothetical protein